MDERKYNVWYDEISLGLQKIRKSGRCLVVNIPNSVVKQHNLTKGDKVLPILIVRKRKLVGELQPDEEWVKMTKKDRIMFKAYLKEKEELDRVL